MEQRIFVDDVVIFVKSPVILAGSANDSHHRLTSPLIGRVEKTHFDDDAPSSSTSTSESSSSSSSSNGETKRLPYDHVLVHWVATHKQTEEKVEALKAIDRSFFYGDIVSRYGDTQNQTGTVVGVHLFVDLEFKSGKERLCGVPSVLLRPVHPFIVDRIVVCNSWLGKIEGCICDVTVQFADNSVCVVSRASSATLIPTEIMADVIVEEYFAQEVTPYYPGQQVRAVATVWASATWRRGQYSSKKHKVGTIINVEPVVVGVDWTTTTQSGDTIAPPEALIAPSKLTLLDYYSFAKWTVGHHALIGLDLLKSSQFKKPAELKFGLNTAATAPHISALVAASQRSAAHHAHSFSAPAGPLSAGPGSTISNTPVQAVPSLNTKHSFGSSLLSFGKSKSQPIPPTSTDQPVTSTSGIATQAPTLDSSNTNPLNSAKTAAQTSAAQPSPSPPSPVLPGSSPAANQSTQSRLGKLKKKDFPFAGDKTKAKIQNLARHCATIVRTYTFIDVQWQDSNFTIRAPALDFIPREHLLENDFWPGDFVVSRELLEEDLSGPGDAAATTATQNSVSPKPQVVSQLSSSSPGGLLASRSPGTVTSVRSGAVVATYERKFTTRRIGTVLRVNSKERTCSVRWRDKPGVVEQLSMYSISSATDYEYRLGDVVLRIDQESRGQGNSPTASAAADQAVTGRLPLIGEIVDVHDGKVTVHWSDKTRSVVLPEQIFAVDTDGDDVDDSEGSEKEEEESSKQNFESSSAGANETVSSSASEDEGNGSTGEDDSEEETPNTKISFPSLKEKSGGGKKFGRPAQPSPSSAYARRGSILSVDSKQSEEDDESDETSHSLSFAETASERAMQIQDIKRRMERLQLMASEDDGESIERSAEALARSEDDDDVETTSPNHSQRIEDSDAVGESDEASSTHSKSTAAASDSTTSSAIFTPRSVQLASSSSATTKPPTGPLNSSQGVTPGASFSSRGLGSPSTTSRRTGIATSDSGSSRMSPSVPPKNSVAVSSPQSRSALDLTSREEDDDPNNSSAPATATASPRYTTQLRRFQVLPSFNKSHRFSAERIPPQDKRFNKLVMKEWKNLKTNLPSGMCLQVCEDRADLLRFLIFGAENTPYYLSPHVFDVMLPPQYPEKPPQVIYQSRGQKLNPHLLENGKVVLSLIGTSRKSHGAEVWNPARSSVLQVATAIQAQILGAPEPYLEENGLERTLLGSRNSQLYNERTLLLSLQLLIKTLRYPPSEWQLVLKTHIAAHRNELDALAEVILSLLSPDSTPTPGREGRGSLTTPPPPLSILRKFGLLSGPSLGFMQAFQQIHPLLFEHLAACFETSPQ